VSHPKEEGKIYGNEKQGKKDEEGQDTPQGEET
jgi:hypothetical protein